MDTINLFQNSENLIQPHDVQVVVFSLFLATTVALVISQIYKLTHRGMNFELSFMSTVVMLAPIVCLVMLFIRGDLVLSLGLIGSLSIIRFRTPIKDTRDMVFLFWTIAVGLGCGTFNWVVVMISTLFISIVVTALYLLKYGRYQRTDYVLVVRGQGLRNPESLDTLIGEYVKESRMRSYEIQDETWEAVYELRYARSVKHVNCEMIEQIKDQDGVAKVSLLAPQLALSV